MQNFNLVAVTLFLLLEAYALVSRLQDQPIDTLGVDDSVDIKLIPPPETTIRWRKGCQKADYCVQEVAFSRGRVEYRSDLEAEERQESDEANT